MALTEIAVKASKARGKITKLSDGGGLQLWVTADGAKRWRLAYRFGGSQKALAIGVYPDVGLKQARDARQAAKRLLAGGVDPMAARKQAKVERPAPPRTRSEPSLGELLDKKRREGKADMTLAKTEWLLSLALPTLGARPIRDITAADVLAVLRNVESRGKHESAMRLRAMIGQVFRYAVATGRADSDPTGASEGRLLRPSKGIAPRSSSPRPSARCSAHRRLSGLPRDLAGARIARSHFRSPRRAPLRRMAEFDLDGALWSIPAGKMKMRRPHRIPLAPRAFAILRDLHGITGSRPIPLPVRPLVRPLHEREHDQRRAPPPRLQAGRDDCARLPLGRLFDPKREQPLEPRRDRAQLAHVDRQRRRAYARADYWDERVRMMAWWADSATNCDRARSISIVLSVGPGDARALVEKHQPISANGARPPIAAAISSTSAASL